MRWVARLSRGMLCGMDSANEHVLTCLQSLRAHRYFTSDPVPSEFLDEIVRVARWTGSARNRQPWRFAVVTAPATQQQLSRLGRYAQHLAQAPAAIAVVSDPVAGGTDTEFDIGRACQNIALAASAQGLGSCPATLYPTENAQAAARLLGLDPPWECRHALSLGYPVPTPSGRSAIPTGRQSIKDLVVYVTG